MEYKTIPKIFEVGVVNLEKIRYKHTAMFSKFHGEIRAEIVDEAFDTIAVKLVTEVLAEKKIDTIPVKFKYLKYDYKTWYDHLIDTIGLRCTWLPEKVRRWCAEHARIGIQTQTKNIELKQYILHTELPPRPGDSTRVYKMEYKEVDP